MSARNPGITRRGFVGVAAASIGLASGRSGLAQAAPVGVRKNIKDLTPAELATLERGVAAMQAIARASPVSWWFQANMHGIVPEEEAVVYQGWSACQHGNWWFLPWHRAYLYYFEKIFRVYSGDSTFMLPYWDWTVPDQLSLPAAFLNPSSPLYDSTRNQDKNAGDPIDPTRRAVSWPTVAGQTIYSTPTGQGIGGESAAALSTPGVHGAMEALCHDLVHDSIGGNMGDPRTAARDPIFWLHHANVDRLWGAWLQARGGDHLPQQSLWTDTPFLFYETTGVPANPTSGVLTSSPTLGYRYATYPTVPAAVVAMASTPTTMRTLQRPTVVATPAHVKTIVASQVPDRTELTAEPLSVTLTAEGAGKAKVEEVLRPKPMAVAPGANTPRGLEPPAPAPAAAASLQVVIDNIQFTRSPGRFYEVYLNLPDLADATGPESLYYGGSLSFFALTGHGPGHGPGMNMGQVGKTAVIEITEAAARLRAAGKFGDGLKVTLIERGPKPRPNAVGAAPATPPTRITIGTIHLQHSGE